MTEVPEVPEVPDLPDLTDVAGEGGGLRPAWRRDRRAVDLSPVPPAEPPPAAAAEPPAPDEDDLERGRTLALIAALGRFQLSLDVLSRQHQRQAEAIEERLDRIERRLGMGDG
jgi:hypothetical protein